MSELVPVEAQQLETIAEARRLIAQAVADEDAETLRELRRRASAVELYQRRAGARAVADDAGEIKLRCERGLGQVSIATRPLGANQWVSIGAETLPDVGHTT